MMSSTATIGAQPAIGARTAGGRLGALAGLAFSLFLFIGVAMVDIPKAASDQALVAWWSDSGHRWSVLASSYLFILAGLCFLVFLVKLRTHLLAAEGGTGELTTLVLASGVVSVAMLLTAAASRGVIGFATESPLNETLPGPDTLRYAPLPNYTALGAGAMLAFAATMATTSWLIVRTAVFGRWLAWVGAIAALAVVLANIALSGAFAIPAVLVWALATSVAMWRRAR
jgi:hypothetical protein